MRTVMDLDLSIHSTLPQRPMRQAYVATSRTPTWPLSAELKALTKGRQSAIFMGNIQFPGLGAGYREGILLQIA